MSSIGENIKQIRKEKKMTQEQMAKYLGISRSYLANLEAGRKNVGENTIKKMSESSGLSVFYLTTGEPTLQDDPNSNYTDRLYKLDQDGIIDIEQVEAFEPKWLKEMNYNISSSFHENISTAQQRTLGASEMDLLNMIFYYLKISDKKDINSLLAILTIINRDKDIYKKEDMTEKDMIKRINDEAKYYKNFLKKIYGFDDNEKSD